MAEQYDGLRMAITAIPVFGFHADFRVHSQRRAADPSCSPAVTAQLGVELVNFPVPHIHSSE
jgi:hypothetical protein